MLPGGWYWGAKQMPDTFLNMRAFLTTVDTGSFSAAARKLKVTPSVVTKRVSQLEWRLGCQLLERTTRHVKLTEFGEQYIVSVRRVVQQYDDIVSGVVRSANEVEGNIRVWAATTQAMLQLLPAIWTFQRKYPGITLEVSLVNNTVNPVEVGADVVFGMRVGSYEGVVEEPLQAVQRVFCAAPEYLARRGTPTHPRDIPTHDCIAYSTIDPAWTFIEASGPVSVAIRPKIATNSNLVILSAACAGAGLAVLSRLQAEPALRTGQLVEVMPERPLSDLWLKAYVPETRIKLPRIQALLAEVRKALLPDRE